jgi:hypothetical protein
MTRFSPVDGPLGLRFGLAGLGWRLIGVATSGGRAASLQPDQLLRQNDKSVMLCGGKS